MDNDSRGTRDVNNKTFHSVHGWRLDATDDFGAGIITVIAMDLRTREKYDLDALVVGIDRLQELHGDLGELLKYLRKGVPGPERPT